MPARRAALVLSAAVLLLSACSDDPAPSATSPATSPVAAAAGASTAPGAQQPAPPPGTVVQGEGPFDDRFTLDALALDAGTVTGALTITSDVSEVIVMEVSAVFYDAAGTALGSAVQVHPDAEVEEELYEGSRAIPVTIAAPAALRSRVSSARVAVPVLVNE